METNKIYLDNLIDKSREKMKQEYETALDTMRVKSCPLREKLEDSHCRMELCMAFYGHCTNSRVLMPGCSIFTRKD